MQGTSRQTAPPIGGYSCAGARGAPLRRRRVDSAAPLATAALLRPGSPHTPSLDAPVIPRACATDTVFSVNRVVRNVVKRSRRIRPPLLRAGCQRIRRWRNAIVLAGGRLCQRRAVSSRSRGFMHYPMHSRSDVKSLRARSHFGSPTNCHPHIIMGADSFLFACP